MLLLSRSRLRCPPLKASVDPVYLHVLIPSVCQMPETHLVRNCIANLHYSIPDIETQKEILSKLENISELINIQPIIRPLFNMLSVGNEEGVAELVRTYQEYELIVERISLLIKEAEPTNITLFEM